MFVHAVYFWLKPGLTAAEEARFLEGARSLATIPSVRHGWVGRPAATRRPVVDHTYTYAAVIVFADQAGLDAYQVDPIHDRFRDECFPLVAKVQIYDSE